MASTGRDESPVRSDPVIVPTLRPAASAERTRSQPPMSEVNPPDDGARAHGTSTLAKIARACVRHRWIVIGAWVARCSSSTASPAPSAPTTAPTSRCPASETKDVQELLEANSPERAGFTSQIVFRAPQGVDDPEVQATMEELFAYVDGIEDITVTVAVRHAATDQPGRHDRVRPARHRRHPHVHRTRRDRRRHHRGGRRTEHRRGSRDRVRRRPVRRVRTPRERGLRPHRRGHHPDPRLRFGARDGPADRHRPVRSRHRLGARVARQQRHHDARLHHRDGGDDRPRRRHRLRAVHRHPVPGEPATRGRPSRTPSSPRSTPAAEPCCSPASP